MKTRKSSVHHGLTKHKLYSVWVDMRRRCENESHPAYPDYGGRGITVCSRWENFALFLEDMGERPEGTSLDRKDNDLNYEPGNCRWATHEEQNTNRRNVVLLEHDGEALTIPAWARKLGVKKVTLYARYYAGMSARDILTTPIGGAP